jgi:hypothetical protein
MTRILVTTRPCRSSAAVLAPAPRWRDRRHPTLSQQGCQEGCPPAIPTTRTESPPHRCACPQCVAVAVAVAARSSLPASSTRSRNGIVSSRLPLATCTARASASSRSRRVPSPHVCAPSLRQRSLTRSHRPRSWRIARKKSVRPPVSRRRARRPGQILFLFDCSLRQTAHPASVADR